MTQDNLKGKHDEKSSPVFMSLSCSYVCMHTPEKSTIKEPLPWKYGQLKALLLITSWCGWGFVVTHIGEQLPWLTIL